MVMVTGPESAVIVAKQDWIPLQANEEAGARGHADHAGRSFRIKIAASHGSRAWLRATAQECV